MVLYCSHNYFHEFWLDPQHRWLKYSPSLEPPLCFGDACRCSLSYLSPDLLCKYLWWLEWEMSNLDPSLRKTQIFSPGFMSFGHTQKWQHSCVDFFSVSSPWEWPHGSQSLQSRFAFKEQQQPTLRYFLEKTLTKKKRLESLTTWKKEMRGGSRLQHSQYKIFQKSFFKSINFYF